MANIIVLAPQGQVGWELTRCAQTLGNVITLGREQLDLSNSEQIRRVVSELQPRVILNGAAYTAVDKAEQEPELAYQINAKAVEVLAEVAKQQQALLVHYSTDYVFNGSQPTPYREQDAVAPLGVYGASKLAGEQAIASVGCDYFIFRTAWVYGMRGKNFLLTMQRLAKERDELRVVADQWGAPTWSRSIAEATAQIVAQVLSPTNPIDTRALSGIYHLTCAGQTNWCEFARAIIAAGSKQPVVHAIRSEEYPTPAKRPQYSVLDNQKLRETFGIQLPAWEQALNLCLRSNEA